MVADFSAEWAVAMAWEDRTQCGQGIQKGWMPNLCDAPKLFVQNKLDVTKNKYL
jgi:hypothetical protein